MQILGNLLFFSGLISDSTDLRAEENVGDLEKSKKKQDLLIDQMNEEIKRLNE